ncbi:aldehyde dehydrogenase (acceptor) [Burkholderia sp. CF099]|nr:aldehyde dehydrogenase (acceptor) [Burkholderia sp. CF099]
MEVIKALAKKYKDSLGFLSKGRRGNFIDGEEVQPLTGKYLDVIDPATDQVVCQAPDSGTTDVDAAVASARKTFESVAWSKMRPADRERLLIRLAELIERNGDELSALETLQSGKVRAIARMVDVGAAAELVRYMAGWATKLEGQTLDNSLAFPGGSEYFTYTKREPLGVVGAIVPWNFPLAIALWKVAPALAAGCTVVLKPSEETPLTALRLAELAIEAGFPGGALNVVCGGGQSTGAPLSAHPGINKLSFTGSTVVGKAIGHAAVDNVTRFTLEMGGKSPAIVLEDADPKLVAQGTANGIFLNQGQVCTAGSRIYVHRKIFDDVVENFVHAARALKIGSGFDAQTHLGPVVSKKHFDRVMGYIDSARSEGATVATGGKRALDLGNFVEPTLFVDVKPEMKIAQEEIFGPVAFAVPYDEIDEVVQQANDTPYGLAASIWSQNLQQVHLLIPRIQAGMVWVNTNNMLDAALPLGGYKQSGYGRDLGRAAIESYTEVKSVCIALNRA